MVAYTHRCDNGLFNVRPAWVVEHHVYSDKGESEKRREIGGTVERRRWSHGRFGRRRRKYGYVIGRIRMCGTLGANSPKAWNARDNLLKGRGARASWPLGREYATRAHEPEHHPDGDVDYGHEMRGQPRPTHAAAS